MTTEWKVTGGGTSYGVSKTGLNRLADLDRPGEHLWAITAAWAAPDPERAFQDTMLLDRENLLVLAGPGCFKCEREYSRKLARMPCTGSIEDIQP